MVDQIRKPGVNITQVFEGTPPAPVTATLVPCIVGPAFEVVELTGDDGAASVESQVSAEAGPLLYKQLPVSIPVSDYPAPRADSSQMRVLVPEVEVALQRTGDFNILDRDLGTAFLKSVNIATKPGIWVSDAHLNDRKGSTFIILVDTGIYNNAASYVVNTAGNAATIAEMLDYLVDQVPGISYQAHTLSGATGHIIHSTRFGASASISFVSASGGSTSTVFYSATDTADLDFDGNPLEKLRVEGSGFYAEDNPVPTVLTSSIVKHAEGAGFYETNAGLASLPASNNDIGIPGAPGTTIGNFASVQIDIHGDVKETFNVAPVNFAGDFPIRAATATSDGDLFSASGPIGQSISDAMVTEVAQDYIKLGAVNTQRSVYDADGRPVRQVYNDLQIATLNSSTPFAPKNGFFVAQSLDQLSGPRGLGTATVATHVSENVVISPAEAAEVTLVGWTEATAENFYNLAFDLIITVNGVSETITAPFAENVAAANDLINTTWQAIFDGKISASFGGGDTFTFATIEKGSTVHLRIEGTAGRDAVTAVGDVAKGDFGTDDELPGLNGTVLEFSLNYGQTVYKFSASSDAIAPFRDTVNGAMGYDALSFSAVGVNGTFTLSSYLHGAASQVRPIESSTGAQILSLSDGSDTVGTDGANPLTGGFAAGTGRPNPDVWVYPDGEIAIHGDIMRNSITGNPVSSNTSARVHVGYRALRGDLTPTANNPGIIRVSSIDTLTEVFGPISNRNPFAMALFFALLNAGDGVEINAIGVDDVSEAEPEGTVAAYASAAEFLRGYEVYSIVPLAQSEDVIALFNNHVTDMSKPELRAERTVIASPLNPDRFNDLVVLSTGETGAESTGVQDQVDLNDSPEAVLNGLGIDTSEEISFEQPDGRQLYLHVTIGDASFRYSVKTVSGGRVSVRTTYTALQNGDGFYSTVSLPDEFVDAEFSLALRGASLISAATGLLDKTAYAETVREAAQQYLNRRQIRLYPETVQSSAVGGINQNIPSYYFAAALAGMVANVEPQEPLTRVPMVGFNGVTGPSLDRGHLNTISAGNAVIEPESVGADPSLRMQGTTDPSTIESREWSVTRAVDAFSKTMRAQLKSRIGRFNITQAYMDDLTMIVDSVCTSAVSAGQFRGAQVVKLEQDVTQPDSILVEIQLEVLYPANYINVTLVV